MAASVEVRIELGHRAKIRDVPTENGHTHDWMVYVKGYEGISLGYFVEKVVFHLHDTYDQPKRVVKSPPYRVDESGFAGFIMPIDVYFRNREEPKTVTFKYDLFLHVESMPPVNHTRLEKLTFTNPTEDFRKKLLDAGALLIRPLDRHSSKERSRDSPSSHSKKDRSKSKEQSKRREGSSQHDEKKKSMSSKKEGRIAAKDIKRHEDDFKHPKMPELTKTSKESSQDGTQRERGRSDKKRRATDIDGGKKKKKKHSSSSPHPQESRPKSLSIPSTSTKKEKIRKIKEKPDLMAGLFAPENSINMSHIKQSREKMKAESSTGSEPKLKKEKRTTAVTPTGSSDSPRLDDHIRATSSKTSTSGNLTLKIKKEKLSPSVEKDPKKELHSIKRLEKIKTEKKDDSTTKHKKRIKENPDVAKIKYQELSKRKSPIVSSSSSSSGSDMEISSNSDSSPERQPKPPPKSPKRESKPDKKQHKTSKSHKESAMTIEKIDKKISIQGISKSEKVKTNHAREDSPNISKSKDRTKMSQSPRSQGSTKQSKKADKKESKPTESREKDTSVQIPRKSKKDKHSSREKDKIHKDSKRSKALIKEEKSGSMQIPDRSKTDSTKSLKPPKSMPPVASIKPKKSSKSPSQQTREKHAHKRPDKKVSKSSENIVAKPYLIAKSEVKKEPPKGKKEKPFSETDSSDDGDLPSDLFNTNIPPHHSPIDGETSRPERSRNDSVSSSSSSSSAASSVSENMPSHSSSSSSSADSSNEDELQKIHETAAITERALSPIDSAYNSYQNAKISYSGESSSPLHESVCLTSQTDSITENTVHNETLARVSPMHDIEVRNRDLYTTSDEEEEFASQLPEKPFQDNDDAAFEDDPPPEEPPNIIIETGDPGTYPHMTQELYLDLQDLQKKLSYITDVDRLSKIANIVHKSRKLLHRDEYLDFDLCALDERTIRKIKRELKAT